MLKRSKRRKRQNEVPWLLSCSTRLRESKSKYRGFRGKMAERRKGKKAEGGKGRKGGRAARKSPLGDLGVK
jgi:hypothetical protein